MWSDFESCLCVFSVIYLSWNLPHLTPVSVHGSSTSPMSKLFLQPTKLVCKIQNTFSLSTVRTAKAETHAEINCCYRWSKGRQRNFPDVAKNCVVAYEVALKSNSIIRQNHVHGLYLLCLCEHPTSTTTSCLSLSLGEENNVYINMWPVSLFLMKIMQQYCPSKEHIHEYCK